MESEMSNKKFFFNSYTINIFLVVTVIIPILVMITVMHTPCKHMKLKNFGNQSCFTANKRGRNVN